MLRFSLGAHTSNPAQWDGSSLFSASPFPVCSSRNVPNATSSRKPPWTAPSSITQAQEHVYTLTTALSFPPLRFAVGSYSYCDPVHGVRVGHH